MTDLVWADIGGLTGKWGEDLAFCFSCDFGLPFGGEIEMG